MTHRHFRILGFERKPPVRLPAEIYSQVLDSMVRTCADALVTGPNGAILLGFRTEEPCKNNWWYIGGRMNPGESFTDALIRNLQREIGMAFTDDRFTQIGTYSLPWPRRQQPPQEGGCHDCSILSRLHLTDEEAADILLNEHDFTTQAWFERKKILSDDSLPEALRCAVMDLILLEKKEELFRTIEFANKDLGGDLEIVAIARELYTLEKAYTAR